MTPEFLRNQNKMKPEGHYVFVIGSTLFRVIRQPVFAPWDKFVEQVNWYDNDISFYTWVERESIEEICDYVNTVAVWKRKVLHIKK